MIVGAFTRFGNTLRFRGRLVSLLAPARGMSTLPAKGGFSRPSSFTHCGVSPMPLGLRLLVPSKHLLPLESPYISSGWLLGLRTARPTENICGNSTCLKTPQSGFLEEAEAVPAESIHPGRSRTARNARTYRKEPSLGRSLYQLRQLKATTYKQFLFLLIGILVHAI